MVGEGKKRRKPSRKAHAGERQEFLVHLEPKLIKNLKLAALEADIEVTASRILEDAVGDWLDRHKSQRSKRTEGEVEKRQFLAKISVRLIKDIKLAALDRKVTASSLVAKAVAEWLARNKSRDHISRRRR
jgi:hypothetical protein